MRIQLVWGLPLASLPPAWTPSFHHLQHIPGVGKGRALVTAWWVDGKDVSGQTRCRPEMSGEVAEPGQDTGRSTHRAWGELAGGGGRGCSGGRRVRASRNHLCFWRRRDWVSVLRAAAPPRPPLILGAGSFPVTQEVPDPTKYFVTRWSTDPWIQMAYSFVKTGGSGEAYDIIAEEIQGTVFFAGEVRTMILNPVTFILVTFF